MKYCHECGAMNPDDAHYCHNCGAFIQFIGSGSDLKGAKTSAAPSPSPPQSPVGSPGVPRSNVAQNASYNPQNAVTHSPPVQQQPLYPAANETAYYPPVLQTGKKNEALAAVLSFILPGLGQIYVGKTGRGVGFLILSMIGVMLVFGFIIVWAYSIYDAYKLAKEYNLLVLRLGRPPLPHEF